MFEIYRLFRSGKSLVSKDQFQFKILYFFSRLNSARVVESNNEEGHPEVIRRKSKWQGNESEEEGDGLCDLIDQLNVECKEHDSCVNCRAKTKEDMKFKNLYKQLIEDIVRIFA